MTREAIEIPRAVNYYEELTVQDVMEAMGKVVCGYWMGFTMQNVLVDAGLAEWKKGDKGVEPTRKCQRAFYDLTVGSGRDFVLVQTGPYAQERPQRYSHQPAEEIADVMADCGNA